MCDACTYQHECVIPTSNEIELGQDLAAAKARAEAAERKLACPSYRTVPTGLTCGDCDGTLDMHSTRGVVLMLYEKNIKLNYKIEELRSRLESAETALKAIPAPILTPSEATSKELDAVHDAACKVTLELLEKDLEKSAKPYPEEAKTNAFTHQLAAEHDSYKWHYEYALSVVRNTVLPKRGT